LEKLRKHSAITFIGCIEYLFYKEDKWAKEIERRLTKILSKFKARR